MKQIAMKSNPATAGRKSRRHSGAWAIKVLLGAAVIVYVVYNLSQLAIFFIKDF